MTVFLTENDKMKHTTEANPGYRFYDFAIARLKTCPGAGECSKWCYGSHGRYVFPNVIEAQEARYQATLEDDFVDKMVAEIQQKIKYNKKKGITVVIRIHSLGDFYSKEYIDKWYQIMAKCDCLFYAYTKSIGMMKEYIQEHSCPKNFTVIYSQGSNQDDLILPTDKQAKVIMKGESTPDGFVDATGNDMIAIKYMYIALPYH